MASMGCECPLQLGTTAHGQTLGPGAALLTDTPADRHMLPTQALLEGPRLPHLFVRLAQAGGDVDKMGLRQDTAGAQGTGILLHR